MNKKQKRILANVMIIALILGGVAWICSMFIHLGNVEFTSNAQVRQHIAPVNSKVQGFIKEIRFDEFQHVKKGDTLILIEDAEFLLQLAQAEANYRNATASKSAMNAGIETTQNNIAVSDAGLKEAKIRLDNAEKEYNRYKKLLESESVTQQQYDAVETQYESMKAYYEVLQRKQQTTRLVKSEQTTRLDQNDAGIALAEAALNLAELNLSYTVITSPCDGFTSRKEIHKGELIQPGRVLLSIVSDEEYWIIANYREKQLKNIKIGSNVDIQVDAIPDVKFKGVVTAISRATGSMYSVVPQDNSTGNFVKVEQRVPVKIAFSDDNDKKSMQLLRSGLNVECKVLR